MSRKKNKETKRKLQLSVPWWGNRETKVYRILKINMQANYREYIVKFSVHTSDYFLAHVQNEKLAFKWSPETTQYTAFSIYVVGSKLQAYATRLKDGMDRLILAAATSSTWNPNISFIQMARHRRSSLHGRGIVNFADNYSLRSHIPLPSCLVGFHPTT